MAQKQLARKTREWVRQLIRNDGGRCSLRQGVSMKDEETVDTRREQWLIVLATLSQENTATINGGV